MGKQWNGWEWAEFILLVLAEAAEHLSVCLCKYGKGVGWGRLVSLAKKIKVPDVHFLRILPICLSSYGKLADCPKSGEGFA